MGLRDKLKDALHGDRDEDTYGNTTSGTHAPSTTHASGTHASGAPVTGGTHGTSAHTTSGAHTSGAHAPGAHAPGAHAPGAHAPGAHAPGANTTSGAYAPGTQGTSGGFAPVNDSKYGATTTATSRDQTSSFQNPDITSDRHNKPFTGTGRDHQTSSYNNPDVTGDLHNKPLPGTGHQASSYQNPDITGGDHHNKPLPGTAGHRQTDSGVHFGDSRRDEKYGANTNTNTTNTQAPYWGSMGRDSPPGTSHTTTGDARNRLDRKDLPLRPNEQPGVASDLGTGRHDGLSGPAATGGTRNTVAGAGSRGYDDQRGNHTLNAVGHQNQSSGIRGPDHTTDDGLDSRLRDRDMGRDTKAGAAVGAGAGLTGAGLAGSRGHEFEQRANADSRDMGLTPSDQYQAGGGVAQSSMLDPYQTGPNAGLASDRTAQGGSYNTSTGTSANTRTGQPHDSHMANKLDPRVDSDRDGSHVVGGRQGGASGMGPGHFGPGHTGAKVMHQCVGCGLDNDISQYFSKDAIYRMS